MTEHELSRGASLLGAVAAMLLVAGCGMDTDDEKGEAAQEIKCSGANECKGMSECAGGPSGSQCKGLNECAGMGWEYTKTKEDCEKLGGTPLA
jgi:hypothetical protein